MSLTYFLAFMSPARESQGSITLTILFGLGILAVIYFVWQKLKKKRDSSESSQLDGTFAILILNIFAMISLAATIIGLVALIGGADQPLVALAFIGGGLVSYATLTAQVVLLQNIIQIRRNTSRPSAAA